MAPLQQQLPESNSDPPALSIFTVTMLLLLSPVSFLLCVGNCDINAMAGRCYRPLKLRCVPDCVGGYGLQPGCAI